MNTSTRPLGASSPELALGLLAARACEDLAANASSRSPKTRIGPSAIFGETRTEPLAFLTSTSHRACGDSWPGIAEGLCCFSQEDPAGFDAGLNFYSYVGRKPMTRRDPLGLTDEPGFAEGLIPIWGSGKQALHDFECGHYGWGIFNSALAISDVFLVKAAVTAVGKAGVSGLVKGGSHSWGATRRWLGKLGIAEKYQHVHHWLVSREWFAGTKWEALFNQRWNLLPLDPPPGWTMDRWHKAIEGKVPGLNPAERVWYGTPDWAKAAAGSAAGRGVSGMEDPCGCE